MSKYTTGEIAKLCDVSVRTVQYYDARGILTPSELSEGGRRLYTEDDLGKMKIICFLRGLELPIDSIKELLAENGSEKVISMLFEEQEKTLRQEIAEKQERADKLAEVKKTLQHMPKVSAQSIGDIAYIMENKKHLKRLHATMLAVGFIMDAIQVATLMIWILRGIWLPFVIGMGVVILLGIGISALYFKNTAYICPECHTVFRPKFSESFLARHTPHTRKLTCTHCDYHGFCVETYAKGDSTSC